MAQEYEEGRTYGSKSYPGVAGNYNWPAKVGVTGGFVRIEQTTDYPGAVDNHPCVLLSPKQFAGIVDFVRSAPTTD